MAKTSIKAKYRETRIVNYRQDYNAANIPSICTSIKCNELRTGYNGQNDTSRHKRAVGIQYKHGSKEDIAGFILKPVARPEYGTIYQHKGMLLQNLHQRYLYILMQITQFTRLRTENTKLPKLWFFIS